MSVLIFVILTLALLAYTCAPLLKNRQPLTVDGEETIRHRAALEQEKLNHLLALRDIDFEQSIGKVSEADCQQLKELYTRQAAAAIAAIDELDQAERNSRG
jgi:hypothetical protein